MPDRGRLNHLKPLAPLLLGIAALLSGVPAQAQQAWPARAIRLVVPSAPGGGADITARIIAPKLSEHLGQQVVVENRPGAGTMIGSEVVARAAPDGYTLLLGISTLAINPAMYRKVPYDALKDFAPISQLVSLPNILVTHPSLPVKTVKELVAFARTRPGSGPIRIFPWNCFSRRPGSGWSTCRTRDRAWGSSTCSPGTCR